MSENSQRGFFSGWKKHTLQHVLGSCAAFGFLLTFLFLVQTEPAEAADGWLSWLNPISTGNIAEGFKWVINAVLYGLLSGFTLLASAAVTLFGWVIDPNNSAFFNLPISYELWKFVRDFFNLFFILVLLFSAFATIFQVQQYHIRKLFLSILIAALLINFSFPISRFIIDATNVPMYFFVNMTLVDAKDPQARLGTILSASHLKDILIPQKWQDFGKVDVSYMFIAVVFMFIFSITLLVFAVLFTIRWIALLILMVFSAVGFAATIVPGMGKYASQWWDNFLKYALYGPAAALMLLVAVKFMAAMNSDKNIERSFGAQATNIAGVTEPGFFANMAFFSIPIILLWFAMGLASSFSIAGAGMVVGWGEKMAKWGGKKAWRGAKWVGYRNSVARGIGGGVKDRYDNNKLVKFFKSPSKTEARIKGALGTGTVKGELDKLHHKEAYEKAKKMKEDNVSNSSLNKALHGNDKVAATAAAMVLTERKAIDTSDDLAAAFKALGSNTREVSELINNASAGALKIDSSTAAGKAQMDVIMNSAAFDPRTGNPKLKEKLVDKINKEGQTKTLIEYDVANGMGRQAAYDKHLSEMTAKEVAKVKGIHGDATHAADAELVAFVQNQTIHTSNWSPKEHADAFAELNAQQKAAWRTAGIHP